MKRYRMTAQTSLRARSYAQRVIPLLGKISKIKGYRFHSKRGDVYTSWECVLLVGENGSARLNGVCWGYHGEGPRTLHGILVQCGLSNEKAKELAFSSERRSEDGVDWEVRNI